MVAVFLWGLLGHGMLCLQLKYVAVHRFPGTRTMDICIYSLTFTDMPRVLSSLPKLDKAGAVFHGPLCLYTYFELP
jgi:hypothetical protein